jgi:LuxR family transcriptional regulator, maltose regulon positive regulatory protein
VIGDEYRPLVQLTPVELDTLKALAAGLTVREVAQARYVSVDTVKSQRRQLYEKLDTSNGSLAIARGYCWGLLDPDVPPELAFEQNARYG